MDRRRAAKLIRMLSSSNQGEVTAAARALVRMDIHKVADLIEHHEPIVVRMLPRQTPARREIVRLNALVKELQAEAAALCKVTRPCAFCGDPFVGRSDAMTCSSSCRTALHRLKRNSARRR
jgi:hypothetical protein